ncbi:hypothetical protein HDU83_007782 [Entophlyctis luteolus]|nr:hypothetical protein HDU83_007782 [Entophlyctis luteolus]
MASSASAVEQEAKRFVNVSAPPQSWNDLSSELIRNMAPAPPSTKRTHISSMLYARDAVGPEFWDHLVKIKGKVRAKLGPSIVSGPAQDLEIIASALSLPKKSVVPSRSLTIVANSSNIIPTLSHVLARAEEMHTCGAYVHWFDRHYANHHRTAPFRSATSRRKTAPQWDSKIELDSPLQTKVEKMFSDGETSAGFMWPFGEEQRQQSRRLRANWDTASLFQESFETVRKVIGTYEEFCDV